LGANRQVKGLYWFRRGEQSAWTAREATDVIGATTIIVNPVDYHQVRMAA